MMFRILSGVGAYLRQQHVNVNVSVTVKVKVWKCESACWVNRSCTVHRPRNTHVKTPVLRRWMSLGTAGVIFRLLDILQERVSSKVRCGYEGVARAKVHTGTCRVPGICSVHADTVCQPLGLRHDSGALKTELASGKSLPVTC